MQTQKPSKWSRDGTGRCWNSVSTSRKSMKEAGRTDLPWAFRRTAIETETLDAVSCFWNWEIIKIC